MAKNSWSGLCADCEKKVFTMIAQGPCRECKSGYMHPSWKRCRDCALKKNRCAYCNKPLKASGGGKTKKATKKKSMATRKFGTGALPPPGHEWEIGATAASIVFVNQASDSIDRGLVTSKTDIAFLNDAIDQIKSGKVVLTDRLEVSDFLKTGKLPQ